MKKLYLGIFLIVLIIAGFLLTASNDSFYFKINKSFDIYGSLFREISNNYVIDVDPEFLFDASINGMLQELDPYTSYYDETSLEDVELITTGNYTGLGVTVIMNDSMLTIIDVHEGYPAEKSGIKIGDRIYMVDTNLVLHENTARLREFTRGEPGSKVRIKVLRGIDNDTLDILVRREKITLKNVSYSGFIDDSIAYLRLERFTRNVNDEFRIHLVSLINTGKMKGLIIDLRDNPGGLLEAAVDICDMFLPKDSKIVSTNGRGVRKSHDYMSINEPLLPDLPLVVIINENSASASEIVAGAMQDNDRAVIIGNTSFGKGLVQTLFDLPYSTKLKMTTARYYTPSGRFIQRIDYDKNITKEERKSDTTYFKTLNGRKVIEYNGITPDSIITNDYLPEFVSNLLRENHLFNFATYYVNIHSELPGKVFLNEHAIYEFNDYLKDNNVEIMPPARRIFKEVLKFGKEHEYSDKFFKKAEELDLLMAKELEEDIFEYSDVLGDLLEFEISRRYLDEKKTIEISLEKDKIVNAAKDIIQTMGYRRILVAGDKSEINEN